MVEMGNAYRITVGELERNHLKDLEIDGSY
jgi:hypothetical protein